MYSIVSSWMISFTCVMSTPKLRRLKQRIRELSRFVTTAQGEEFEQLIKELQETMHEHAEETRRVLLSQQLQHR